MKIQKLLYLIALVILVISFNSSSPEQKIAGQNLKIEFIEKQYDNRIDVLIGGNPFTSFLWPENICKPILFPLLTATGTEITRGFPLNPRPGERLDHVHQSGAWFTYGNVNGSDFWGNGSKGLGTRNENGGVIKHLNVEKLTEGNNEGLLITNESWLNASGEEILKEHTEYHFIAEGLLRIIDRITTLTADEKEVSMPDTKEGMFGIRVARQLELPSESEVTVKGTNGNDEKIKNDSENEISGNYLSSEGITGKNVWGTRARWMHLTGKIKNEEISLVICDHPKNIGYPTYWHAREYGLFSANPLGVKDFTNSREAMNFSIPAGKSTTFRYRIIIASGSHLTSKKINSLTNDFASKY